MSGYSPDEKLRLEQLRVLRRKWLKDQELSPREPVLPPENPGPVQRFWQNFLKPQSLWRQKVYKTYGTGVFVITRVLIPAWIVHYYVKYHVQTKPYGIMALKPRIFPGDRIIETGEVIPPLDEKHEEHHH
ncbi:NADH dehydrogenase [ubiquinone] 1 beta subcomplex subunit 6 [Microcaecilia unicolor]|uniref:NADH dehydrogenase [ubiquinone] 1 beta subcomplex subunit 6 n=1 Tax=Microcaecilia unicolor TaxID=1415580 RepID=A0A6P7XH49_9AMPH|nr:NADH dehydrogenase [ubiquinone] 1 beta subcomplex subunit 6 [Microcaecilia unicolor]